MYIDSHAHLDDNRLLPEIENIISGMEAAGVEFVINASCDLRTQTIGIELAEKYDKVYALIGNHAHEARFFDQNMIDAMTELSTHKKVVGVGEIGLDFFYNYSLPQVQKKVFEQQLALADKFNLPVVLHVRDAYGEALEILKANKKHLNNGVLLHCYSGSAETVKEFSRICDCYFSLGGAITFKTAKKEEVIKAIPLDKLLTETDSPYLTPEPYRGKINTPANVKFVLEKIAAVREKDNEEMKKIVRENTLKLFTRIKLERTLIA